jgi:hypothetical protein
MKASTAVKSLRIFIKSNNYFKDYVINKLNLSQKSKIIKKFITTKDISEVFIASALIDSVPDYNLYKLSEKIGELQETEYLVNLFESLPNNIKTKIKTKICKN